MIRTLSALFLSSFLLAAQQGTALDDQILEKGDKLLEEAKAAYEDARAKSAVAMFVEAGFKLEEARIKFIVLQEIGSPEKQKTATDRLRAINQLSKLIHDGKVAISGKGADASSPAPVAPPPEAPDKSADPTPKPAPAPPRPLVDVTKRAPIPDAASQKEADRLLKDLFKDQYAKKSPADKQALARALLEQALKSQGDPVSIWVTCREARDLAAQTCDVRTLIAAIEEVARSFDVDPLPMKSADLATAGKAARTPEDFLAMSTALDKLIDELLAADQYDPAEKVAASTLQYSRKTNDARAVARATARTKDVTEVKARYQAMKGVLQTLAKTPDDPGANLEMGQFLCFVKANWDLGLRFMAKSSDAGMKSLAEKELGLPLNPADQTVVADGWYDLAEKEKVPYRKNQLLGHSRTLYEGAVDDAVGLARARIEKRLELIQNALGASAGERASINLIRFIDPAQDSFAGDWVVTGGNLLCTKKVPWARVQVPYLPPDEYDLTIVVERKEPGGSLHFGLARGTIQFMVALEGGNGTGLEILDGKLAKDNETAVQGSVLAANKPSTVVCSVRKEGVTVTIDDRKIVDWKGPFSRLKNFPEFQVPNPRALCIGSYGAVCVFTKVALTPVSGQGKRLR
jgi:hypothetical protein